MEKWVRVNGLRQVVVCEFCFETVRKGRWAWRNERGRLECDACRKEGLRAERARMEPVRALWKLNG